MQKMASFGFKFYTSVVFPSFPVSVSVSLSLSISISIFSLIRRATFRSSMYFHKTAFQIKKNN